MGNDGRILTMLCDRLVIGRSIHSRRRICLRDAHAHASPEMNACTCGRCQPFRMDEKNQIITTNCWLNQAWIDYKLSWNPAKYGGIKVVRLPHDSIWKPDILLYNNADVSSYKSSISTNVIVSSDGNVTWLSMVIFRSSCAVNVKYFPFDEQNCSMLFSSWTYDGFQLNMLKVGEDGDLSNYIHNNEWTLVKLHVVRNVEYYSCCSEPYPDVTYTIQMRRKPLFYVFNMILPCLLITLVALLGFYIPSDSGEKVTMGITTLLSMTVFLMLVTESMPPTSDVLPLIGREREGRGEGEGGRERQSAPEREREREERGGERGDVVECVFFRIGRVTKLFPTRLYYGITIAIVSFATAMTVMTLNVHNKGQRGAEVPNIVRKICFGVLAKILCIKMHSLGGATAEKASGKCAESGMSSYVQLRKSNNTNSMRRDNSPNRMTVLDFLPATDIDKDTFHSNLPENGGLPPTSRFSTRLGLAGSSSGDGVASDNFERQFLRVLNRINQTIELNEMRVAEEDRRNIIKYEWQQVALVVDRMLLFVFMVTTLGVTLRLGLGDGAEGGRVRRTSAPHNFRLEPEHALEWFCDTGYGFRYGCCAYLHNTGVRGRMCPLVPLPDAHGRATGGEFVVKCIDTTGSIKFPYEEESGNSLPFLDTLVIRKEDGTVKLLVYRTLHAY
ncbi:Ligand-gated ion channel 4 [Lamellibrachia satsuma]|nr:Ligand-gated ion channel 4 [Lamellibrachia satsuma]